MKVNRMTTLKKILTPLAGVFLLMMISGCDRHRNHPGWDYFPDMFYSKAYESYTPNPNFPDGKTMQNPVDGTVPQEIIPFQYSIDEEERLRAGSELLNPFPVNKAVLVRGEEVYSQYCLNCHGHKGDGKGFLYTSGKYVAVPRSLINETGKNLRGGEIYHSITLGYGSMGAHGAQIRPEDRWKVISYIQYKLQNQGAESKNIQKK